MKIKIASALALATYILSGSGALAHAHLQAETPAADALVTVAPTTLALAFSEGLEIKLSTVTLKGPDDKIVPTEAPSLDSNDDKLMRVPVVGSIGAGKYTVEWHALSKDGHTTHGSYQFTVGPR
jgi:hypothetical protein